MNSTDKIKQFFKNAELGINPDADEKVFNDVLAQQKITKKIPPCFLAPAFAEANLSPRKRGARGGDSIWRVTMKSPITKIAVAAVLVIACLMGVFVFNQTSGTAWAIEQSIEALSKYNAIIIEGSKTVLDEEGKIQIQHVNWWAVANEDQTKVEKERVEIEGVPIIVTNGQQTWRYEPKTNTVMKNSPYSPPEIWFGSRFLEQLKSYHESGLITYWEVTYGKDPDTGKQRAFLTCAWLDKRYNGPRSMWLEIDTESNLLVSFKQWENANCEGPAQYNAEKIAYYESLPDELFEFEIPEGATVIEN